MELEGCSNPGLSYTDKYIKAIIAFYNYVLTKCKSQDYEYKEFQKLVKNNCLSDESEIRMLIPFMLKTGILNENHCIKAGTKIKRIKVDFELFSLEGHSFVKFLKIVQNSDYLLEKEREKIKLIYYKYGLIQFDYLRKSKEYIYDDLYVFLRKYDTIDKNEFFIITNCRKNNIMSKLDEYINDYRHNKITDIKIINNINAFQYITKFLIQIGILQETSNKKRLKLGNLISNIGKEGEKYEFRS